MGVYLPETSNILDFIKENVPTILVEPYPPAIEAIKEYFQSNDNIILKEVAVYDKKGSLELSTVYSLPKDFSSINLFIISEA